MAKVVETYVVEIDCEEIQPLLALCENQRELIKALHQRVKSSVLDIRVNEMIKSIEELRIDDHLVYIQHEAFKAGYNAAKEGSYFGKSKEENIEIDFNEWLKERDA